MMEELIPLFGTQFIQIIGILIGVDVLFGIIAAVVKKEFALRKLALFMKGPVLAYIFGFVVLELAVKAFLAGDWAKWALMAVFAIIALALSGSILRNLNRIGLPLPRVLKE